MMHALVKIDRKNEFVNFLTDQASKDARLIGYRDALAPLDEESADWSMIRAQIELFLSAAFHKKRASFIDDMAGFQIYDAAAFGSLKRLEVCFDYEAEKQSEEQAALLEFLIACESKIVDVSDVKDPYRFRFSED